MARQSAEGTCRARRPWRTPDDGDGQLSESAARGRAHFQPFSRLRFVLLSGLTGLCLFLSPAWSADNADIWDLHMRRAMEAHRTGDLEAAERELNGVLPIAETFAAADPRLGETLLALGAVRYDRQDYAGAGAVLERAVSALERSAGPDSTKLAASLNALGLAYGQQGAAERAQPRYERALAVYERVLGRNHPRVAGVAENLGGLWLTAGRYEAAAPLFARALAIKERAYGTKSPELVQTLQSYALVLTYIGRGEEAESLEARAQAILARLSGETPP